MYERDTLIWAAGVLDGVGTVACTIEQGPTGKGYHAISLLVPLGDSDSIARLATASGNGNVMQAPTGWELGGYAAIRGFLQEVWQWLTPATRKRFNAELKRFKYLKSNASIQG